jgi:DNA-binding transcriptional MerR regulator
MTASTGSLWTLDELGAQVALALAVDYEGAPDNRTRDIPDRRTIRYYTTLGLIDRAAEMRGRTALYGRRHLLQLVAIKRLQARGLSLEEIQQRLVGMNDKGLNQLARLPQSVQPSADTAPDPAEPTREAAFWTTPPAPVAEQPAPTETEPGPPWQGVPLDEQALLLLEASRVPDEDDLAALRLAAAPLLKLLQKRRLLRPRRERGSS